MHRIYTQHDRSLIARSLAREHGGRLVPILKGGDPAGDNIFPAIPDDFAALDDDALQAFIDDTSGAIQNVAGDHGAFVTDAYPAATLVQDMTASVAALKAARDEFAARDDDPGDETDEETAEPDESATVDDSEVASTLEALAAEAVEPEAVVEPETVVAAAPPARRRPARAAHAEPPIVQREQMAALIAAATVSGVDTGDEIDMDRLSAMMVSRRQQFGRIPDGTKGEKITLGRFAWKALYPDERRFNGNVAHDASLIAAAIDETVIRFEMDKRARLGLSDALTASGGLCAPVTPYYQLQNIAVADRPVRASLPAFSADRGGLRFARPPALSAITTAVGVITEANDAAGGTFATKTCQIVDCPDFSEVDVATIYHCLQFGNLMSRTYPEMVAHYNNLVLADHARVADSRLLTQIDGASTAVTAASLGLGASATLPSQILQAAAGIRSRNRMAPDSVLRVMLPAWALDLLVSDVYRSQFERFDMNQQQFVQLLRANNVEPSFYIDGASGKSQVFGTQTAGTLLSFPSTVNWFIFPEGSFLYIDGGTLELGIVRDSVLNSTNDYQIFGESFEEVAYVGVESLSVVTTVCDNGTVALPHAVTSCDNSHSS